jgi:hypothetical protein
MAKVRNYEVMLGHAETLYVVFCNVVQCHMLLNYLTLDVVRKVDE